MSQAAQACATTASASLAAPGSAHSASATASAQARPSKRGRASDEAAPVEEGGDDLDGLLDNNDDGNDGNDDPMMDGLELTDVLRGQPPPAKRGGDDTASSSSSSSVAVVVAAVDAAIGAAVNSEQARVLESIGQSVLALRDLTSTSTSSSSV